MAAAGAEERERLAAEKARLEREAAEARAKAEGGADTSTGGLHVAVTTAVAAREPRAHESRRRARAIERGALTLRSR